jgi:hypothetical protein
MSLLGNPALVVSVIVAQAVHIGAMYIPWLRDTLELAPISLLEWACMLLASSSLIIVSELDKAFGKRSFATTQSA